MTDESGLQNRRIGYLEDYIHHFENVILFDDGVEMRLHIDTLISSKLDSAAIATIDTISVDTIIKQKAIHHLQSNYDRSILAQNTGRHSNKLAEIIFKDNVHRIFIHPIDTNKIVSPTMTQYQQQRLQAVETISSIESEEVEPLTTNILQPKETPEKPEVLPESKQDTGKIDIDNYLFQSEFDDEEVPTPVQQEETTVKAEQDESEKIFPPVELSTVSRSSKNREKSTSVSSRKNHTLSVKV